MKTVITHKRQQPGKGRKSIFCYFTKLLFNKVNFLNTKVVNPEFIYLMLYALGLGFSTLQFNIFALCGI